uniref:Uncharacterized protein n=1 Tax=Anopheles minimus TaxID=112268 RepID=A0A182WPC5_9DIPT
MPFGRRLSIISNGQNMQRMVGLGG